jgi:plastocyanin
MLSAPEPVPSCPSRRLLGLGCAMALALCACRAEPAADNPAGYPPIPRGSAAAPAPTPGGAAPTVVGLARSPAASKEGQGQLAAGGAGATGPAAGNAGIYEAYTGAGSASLQPAPPPAPTPVPVATVTISRARGFEPATVAIAAGQAILWRNDDRSPQTVTGDPAVASDSGHVVLPAGAAPWGSSVLNSGDTYVQAFAVQGEYLYTSVTLERQGVVGRITVR